MKKAFRYITDFLKRSDLLLLLLCICATLFGMLMIYSSTHHSLRYVGVQGIALVLGVFCYFLFSFIDLEIIADKWKILFIFSIGLMLTLLKWGVEGETGNKAWLRFFGIGIQPSEIVKIPFTIMLAKLISHNQERRGVSSIVSILELCMYFGTFFVLIIVISADLGSALVYLFIFAVVLYLSGVSFYWFIIGIAGVAAAIPIAWTKFLSERQKMRILAPYDSTIDPTGTGITWQPRLSKNAIASGGVFGQGIFKGQYTQNGTIPHQETDFIFSAVGEECGLIGCSLLILLITFIIIRCMYNGMKSNNSLGMLTCAGIAAMLTFQMLENIGMCIGLTPVIGLTLPFFSYGGSSIVTTFAAMGIVSGVKMRPRPSSFSNIK